MRRSLLLVVVVVAVLGACSSSSKSASSSSSSASSSTSTSGTASSGSSTGTITIKGFAFNAPPTVPAGTITIRNEDSTRHTFHPDKDGAFQAVEIDGGKSGETVLAPGTYAFHCNIHTTMKGTITVTG